MAKANRSKAAPAAPAKVVLTDEQIKALAEAREAATEASKTLASIYDATNEFNGGDGDGLVMLIKIAAEHGGAAAYKAETILDKLTKTEAP